MVQEPRSGLRCTLVHITWFSPKKQIDPILALQQPTNINARPFANSSDYHAVADELITSYPTSLIVPLSVPGPAMLRFITRQVKRRPLTQTERLLSSQQSPPPADVPTEADVVIIGGGSAGCNTLYQLARQGVKAVLLERAKLTAGATWHNTGIIWSVMPRDIETQLLNASRELVLRIQQETGVDPLWNNNGGIYVARTKERLEELKRLATIAKSFEIPASLLSPAETKKIFPLINEDVILGALHSPYDGTADPSALCQGLTTGAIAAGAQVVENCPVSKILVGPSKIGGHPQVQGVVTPHGTIRTNCLVNCSGEDLVYMFD
ncbi:hypothetical protein J6590_012138 [Homalodisca vitripennis]|nr:hypothetical protein J6590_012138 [Homalodisca vitripennis]